MNKNNYGILDHIERFKTEQDCKDFLYKTKWEGGVVCPNCGNKHMNYFISKCNRYKCPSCKTQFSLLKGTIFEGTKLPLMKWYWAIYLFMSNKRGISSHELARKLGIQQRTAWFVLHRLREALRGENNRQLFGEVTVDETTIAPVLEQDRRLQVRKRKHDQEQERIHGMSKYKRLRRGIKKKRGRKAGTTNDVLKSRGKSYSAPPSEKKPFGHEVHLLGMKQKYGLVQFKIIGIGQGDKTKNRIYPMLKKQIHKSSTIYTDHAKLYNDLSQHFAAHKSVTHGKTFVSKDGTHTNDIENAWMHLKKYIKGTYFFVSKKYLLRYLDEIAYKWNRLKQSQKQIFEGFFKNIAGKRIKAKELSCFESLKIAV